MKFLNTIFGKSSKKGKILKKIGIGIGSIGLGLEFDVLPLENMLTNEKYIFWLLVVKYVCMFGGAALTAAGAVTTPEEDNQEINQVK